jgi:ketosteroid isomerase-like protein
MKKVLFTVVRVSVVLLGTVLAALQGSGAERPGADLAAFNTAFRNVILKMDSAGTVALWADDGVSLLPDTAPMVGKPAIARFMEGVTKDLAGYHVTKEEIEWKDMRVAGDWASEWGIVHQEVIPPGEKPAIEVYGRIALVLHKEAGGWKLEQEMWNSGPKP